MTSDHAAGGPRDSRGSRGRERTGAQAIVLACAAKCATGAGPARIGAAGSTADASSAQSIAAIVRGGLRRIGGALARAGMADGEVDAGDHVADAPGLHGRRQGATQAREGQGDEEDRDEAAPQPGCHRGRHRARGRDPGALVKRWVASVMGPFEFYAAQIFPAEVIGSAIATNLAFGNHWMSMVFQVIRYDGWYRSG